MYVKTIGLISKLKMLTKLKIAVLNSENVHKTDNDDFFDPILTAPHWLGAPCKISDVGKG
jgi:hypothetical protein